MIARKLFEALRGDVERFWRAPDLFAIVEADIPLHLAVRSRSGPACDAALSDRTNSAIKFAYFTDVLHSIGVELQSGRTKISPSDSVRLRPAMVCDCGRRAYKKSPYGQVVETRCGACSMRLVA